MFFSPVTEQNPLGGGRPAGRQNNKTIALQKKIQELADKRKRGHTKIKGKIYDLEC